MPRECQFPLSLTRLRSLSHLDPLAGLERLFLGGNKIQVSPPPPSLPPPTHPLPQDYAELDKLHCLSRLLELSLLDNPVSRRHQHRLITVFNLPALLSLDGLRVTSQERQNAEAIFSINEEQVTHHCRVIFSVIILGASGHGGNAVARDTKQTRPPQSDECALCTQLLRRPHPQPLGPTVSHCHGNITPELIIIFQQSWKRQEMTNTFPLQTKLKN